MQSLIASTRHRAFICLSSQVVTRSCAPALLTSSKLIARFSKEQKIDFSSRVLPLKRIGGSFSSSLDQGKRPFSASSSNSTMAPIQLYSMATPNGQKIGILLEELGIEYEPHLINISKNDQFSPDFIKINPNSKIPAIVDPEGPDGKPLAVFESGAIMIYLAEKFNSPLLPKEGSLKYNTLQWLFFQVGGIGPMTGQLGHFMRISPETMADPSYPKNRYLTEVIRLFKVVEKQLEGKDYLTGEYSIADIASAPWMKGAFKFLAEHIKEEEYPNVSAWLNRIYERPAVIKGITVCSST